MIAINLKPNTQKKNKTAWRNEEDDKKNTKESIPKHVVI